MSSKADSPAPAYNEPPKEQTSASNSPRLEAEVDERKQPWRDMPSLQASDDTVDVTKVRDMRLYGKNVNAHS